MGTLKNKRIVADTEIRGSEIRLVGTVEFTTEGQISYLEGQIRRLEESEEPENYLGNYSLLNISVNDPENMPFMEEAGKLVGQLANEISTKTITEE